MKWHIGLSLSLTFTVLMLGGGLGAETQPGPAAGPGEAANPSPFLFAKSGAKHDRAGAAGGAGAKVIGGEVAKDGAWPWQVALLVNGQPVSTDAQFCGGSLVLDNWVLTAAHCVHMQDPNGKWVDLWPQDIQVLAGTNTLTPGSGDLIPVEAIYIHPSYVGTLFDFDIALIKLTRAPNVPYKVVDLPDASFGDLLNQQGVTTFVTGWGLQNGGAPSAELRQAQIQVLDRDLCNNAMMEAKAADAAEAFSYAAQVFGINEQDAGQVWDQLVAKAPLPMSENMICSGTFEGGKTSCNGDSGGPLVVPMGNGTYVQAGIVSWGLSASTGKGCEETALFSAYTNISKFVPWLNQIVAEHP